jgi:glutaredoxin-dependent peroxiredoxin
MQMTSTTTTAAPPQVGQKAPEITLPNTMDGSKPWSLHEALKKGPVVVAFMPGAFTGTCTKESCNFTANLSDYAKFGAQVVGVTVDSKHAQAAWAARDNIKIPLLSDFEKKTVTAWGLTWASSWGNTTKRATFIVDRNGIVRYANVQPNASDEPNYAEIQKALQGLK